MTSFSAFFAVMGPLFGPMTALNMRYTQSSRLSLGEGVDLKYGAEVLRCAQNDMRMPGMPVEHN